MTDTPSTAPSAPAFPQDRGCPYHPPAQYPELAARGPVGRMTLYDGREVWAVTGHAEARALLADPRLSSDRQNPSFPVVVPRVEDQAAVGIPLLGVDDPEHARQRRMLIPRFSLKRVAAMRPRIQETVDGLIDAMLDEGPEAELVSAFALPVPSMVICQLLGVPYADHEFFEAQSRALLASETADEAAVARESLKAYLHRLVDAKEAHPGDGLLDELIADRLADGQLDRDELVMLVLVLLVAGHETTANMIALGTFTLLEHPAQLAALTAEPGLMPGAVEELLRYLSIADGMVRLATEDIELGGHTIRAGDGVLLPTSVINRDSGAYEQPDALDVRRVARHHVAFGYGVHQCLGQNLARAEMEIALTTLFARIPTLRLAVAPDEVPVKPGSTLQGLYALPVTW
ncbi:cytochrome P450 [Streptomyces cinnamoneus]|uniref:Cytochrome P450 n=1 Tax=Streptomyces cinnamoneus TaxID=53446 RepID=A0A2G1XEQ1_STRCJ|nr:cytochrome P450 [Streptomyces cinnamoneus]PHQ49700.1 cytochrome P450 [Streptomyces cinnamoneus]PPT16725.1 cytochrome P450 [Streptomyces cinnamoneus]